jgi:hypothetical protein
MMTALCGVGIELEKYFYFLFPGQRLPLPWMWTRWKAQLLAICTVCASLDNYSVVGAFAIGEPFA